LHALRELRWFPLKEELERMARWTMVNAASCHDVVRRTKSEAPRAIDDFITTIRLRPAVAGLHRDKMTASSAFALWALSRQDVGRAIRLRNSFSATRWPRPISRFAGWVFGLRELTGPDLAQQDTGVPPDGRIGKLAFQIALPQEPQARHSCRASPRLLPGRGHRAIGRCIIAAMSG